jgi:enoyl-CoA hydratase
MRKRGINVATHLIVERHDQTLVVWLNRPPVNALNRELLVELNDVLDATEGDPGVRAIVFASRLKSFCAGADLKMNLGLGRLGMGQWTFLVQRTFDRIEQLALPTIAAVNGPAAGGGCELALSCDIRIVAPAAFLALPEAKRGILPGAGGTQRLARMVGYGRAMEILITGRSVPAEEALRIGLAHQLAEDVLEAAETFAQQFVAISGPSIREIKRCLLGGVTGGYWHGSILEATAADRLTMTPEYQEGVTSFLERRPPNFSQARDRKAAGQPGIRTTHDTQGGAQ